jgi:hypothetical protein
MGALETESLHLVELEGSQVLSIDGLVAEESSSGDHGRSHACTAGNQRVSRATVGTCLPSPIKRITFLALRLYEGSLTFQRASVTVPS